MNNKENLKNMAGLDLYLESLTTSEYEEIQDKMVPMAGPSALLSMDLYAGNFHQKIKRARKQEDLKNILKMDSHFKLQIDEQLIFNNDYDALVLTDHTQTIQWVNKGFSKMTGYPAKFALGKSPKFLQGEETDPNSKRRIREQLVNNKIFTEIVINYRKNRDRYKCEITIIPLRNRQNSLTHYLAIEKEVA